MRYIAERPGRQLLDVARHVAADRVLNRQPLTFAPLAGYLDYTSNHSAVIDSGATVTGRKAGVRLGIEGDGAGHRRKAAGQS